MAYASEATYLVIIFAGWFDLLLKLPVSVSGLLLIFIKSLGPRNAGE